MMIFKDLICQIIDTPTGNAYIDMTAKGFEEISPQRKYHGDIYYLSKTFDFEGAKLQSAVFETLQRRGTPYDRSSFKRFVALAEDEDMQKRWKYDFVENK